MFFIIAAASIIVLVLPVVLSVFSSTIPMKTIRNSQRNDNYTWAILVCIAIQFDRSLRSHFGSGRSLADLSFFVKPLVLQNLMLLLPNLSMLPLGER